MCSIKRTTAIQVLAKSMCQFGVETTQIHVFHSFWTSIGGILVIVAIGLTVCCLCAFGWWRYKKAQKASLDDKSYRLMDRPN